MLISDNRMKLSLLLVIIYEIVNISADKNMAYNAVIAEEVLGKYISFLLRTSSIIKPNIKSVKNKNAIK